MNPVEVLICPTGGQAVAPVKVWESRLPNGRAVRYGQFGQHSHWGQECEWSHMVQPLVEHDDIVPSIYM